MSAHTIRLSDYTQPAYWVETVHLEFDLNPSQTTVTSTIRFVPNTGGDLRLDGKDLTLLSASIEGTSLDVTPDADGLTIPASDLPNGAFTWQATVKISPESNTALEGLYLSNGMYCTQCEAEGFRRITFYPDRPDVMAVFTVTLRGDAPILLSNGNLTQDGDGFATWHDPWPKPAYLFALVAGDLKSVDDSFITKSGRDVALKIWVRDGDQDRSTYAMDALKRSMKWDEDVYNLEYDLDLFQIVAVDDFNAGAMENKGLNIFNSKLVLANPDTATDQDFELIESVIAHEYFHNWTGNRITCRDWFQLCLKEGLTVYRDQQFTSDTRSAPVKRIDDVLRLRGAQFREDAGPLAHNVRPEEYVEINNFYTATVYEKGAEVVGMLRKLVSPEAYKRALDCYFERHDGQACTIEDWLAVFEDTTNQDLSQFKLWYSQAGTPRIEVSETYENGEFTLTFRQTTPATPGQPDKQPMVIPLEYGLLGSDGAEIAAATVVLDKAEHSITVKASERPVPSLNRGFSAPIILNHTGVAGDDAFRLAHDTDPFNRWEAGRNLALNLLVSGGAPADWTAGLRTVAMDADLDPAFRALTLQLPSDDDVAQALKDAGRAADPLQIFEDRAGLETALALEFGADAAKLRKEITPTGPYSPDGAAPGGRALANRMLSLMTRLDPDANDAKTAFDTAANMTDRMAALSILVRANEADHALTQFYDTWRHTVLVMDKWFAVQASNAAPDDAVEKVKTLTEHSDFNWKNPNRFRSLIGAFAAQNAAGFHREDGAGYKLVADWLLKLDPVNPQTTARMASVFGTWKRYDVARQDLMQAQLERIASAPDLSRNTAEIVGRIRAA